MNNNLKERMENATKNAIDNNKSKLFEIVNRNMKNTVSNINEELTKESMENS